MSHSCQIIYLNEVHAARAEVCSNSGANSMGEKLPTTGSIETPLCSDAQHLIRENCLKREFISGLLTLEVGKDTGSKVK